MNNFSRMDPARIILHVRVTDLPGCPQDRHNTLGKLFCEHVLHRKFHNKIQVSNYDFMHLPPQLDKPVRRWFIFDSNVNCPLEKEEVLSLPRSVYYVSRPKDEWRVTVSLLSLTGSNILLWDIYSQGSIR